MARVSIDKGVDLLSSYSSEKRKVEDLKILLKMILGREDTGTKSGKSNQKTKNKNDTDEDDQYEEYLKKAGFKGIYGGCFEKLTSLVVSIKQPRLVKLLIEILKKTNMVTRLIVYIRFGKRTSAKLQRSNQF